MGNSINIIWENFLKVIIQFTSLINKNMGVTKEIITPGDGKTYPTAGDTVTVHYIGTLATDGTKFDSSHDRGQPFSTEIGVGKVIKGWDQGVMQMCQGEKALLKITSDYAFGTQGAGENIVPPNTDVNFEVQLISVQKAGAVPAEPAQPSA